MSTLRFTSLKESVEKLGRFFLFGRRKLKTSALEQIDSLAKDYSEQSLALMHSATSNKQLSADLLQSKDETKATSNKLQLTEGNLNKSVQIIKSQKDELSKLQPVKKKFDLVNSALSAPSSTGKEMQILHKLIYEDFINFANKESTMAEEAQAMMVLHNIEHELIRITLYSKILSKTIGAIGGGFSSGKSAFVNSFIKDKNIRLPVGIKPVTAIPSYVINSTESQITGYSNNGGVFEISVETYSTISHEFLKSFDFNLKDLIPYLTVATSLDESIFSNLCIIDTPGYNPASGAGFTSTDVKTSQEHIKEAHFLIWLVGIDATGTIPNSDLKFLEDLCVGKDRKLYVVANKADLKSKDAIEEILDEFEEVLIDKDLKYEGVAAYSSVTGKVVGFRKKDLIKFLKENNKQTDQFDSIIERVNEVFNNYHKSITQELKKTKKSITTLKGLMLDLAQGGMDFDSVDESQLEKRIACLKKNLTPEDQLNGYLQQVEDLRASFIKCIANIRKSFDEVKS